MIPAAPVQDSASPAPGMDPELHEIYVKETAGHLASIRDFLAATNDATAPYPVSEALHRSCHTLSGTAKTAGALAGITLAEPLNRYVRKLHDHGLGLSAEGVAALEDTCEAMQEVAERSALQMHEPVEQLQIVERLQALERAADDLIAQLPQQGEAGADEVQDTSFSVDESGAHVVDMSGDVAVQMTAPEVAHDGDAGQLLAWSYQHLPVHAAEAAAPASRATVAEMDGGGESVRHASLDQAVDGDSNPASATKQDNQGEPGRMTATAADGPMQQDDDVLMDPEAEDDDYDPEVVAIFTEEATELLETAEQAFGAWRQDRANAALVFELKRVVHTLKGGAGMAGIRTMAGLSHDLETLMGKVESREMSAGAEVFDALQAGLDELHRMRDDVADGQRCEPAPALMRRIRTLCGIGDAQVRQSARPSTSGQSLAHVTTSVQTPSATQGVASDAASVSPSPIVGGGQRRLKRQRLQRHFQLLYSLNRQ